MRTSEQGQPQAGDYRSDATRPETHQTGTLAANAWIVLAGAAICMPFTLLILGSGNYGPFVITILGLVIGFATLSALKSVGPKRAAQIQVAGLSAVGLLMTLMDPQLVDFGFATMLLAPVLAALLGTNRLAKAVWGLSAATVPLAIVFGQGAASGLLGAGVASGWAAGVVYALSAILVAHSAHRLSSASQKLGAAHIDTFRQLIDNIEHAVLRFSSSGELTFISNAAERLFGCPLYELAGAGLVERVQIQDRPAFLTALSATQSSGTPRTLQIRMRKDEPGRIGQNVPSFAWIEVNFSAVTGSAPHDDRYEVIAMMSDVSKRRAEQEAMGEARKLAEEASEAKSHFLASVGHELRTPLNAIVGFSEMMSAEINGKLEPGQREYVDIIHRSGHHLLDIVNMLLDMSKIEAGRFQMQLEAFAPDVLLGPCVQIVEQQAAQRDIKLVVEHDRDLPQITADERALRQILINLLSNAVKFSHPGGEVKLRMRRQGASLKLSVSDHGIGMSDDIAARVGEPFFQAHRGLARKYEGTGLGLSIVKGLVELHQGRLQIATAPEQGTTMTVLLPIEGPQVEPMPQVVTALPKKQNEQVAEQWPERKSVAQ